MDESSLWNYTTFDGDKAGKSGVDWSGIIITATTGISVSLCLVFDE
jgi:hypothetical protein